MPAFNIAVIDEGGVGQAAVADFVAAAIEYVGRWLLPFWPEVQGTTIVAAERLTPGFVPLVLAVTTTQAGSLGYHTKTADGLPTGNVELDACRQYNVPWTAAGTHELGELLVNPELDRIVSIGDRQYPVEIADPCIANTFQIGDVAVANFSTPAYWDQNSPANSRFDAMGLVTARLPSIPSGGWLEWSENGAFASAYGPDIAPEMIRYMRERQGRRWRWRGMK